MSEQTVQALVLGLFALLGGAGFWGYMTTRKEAPIKKRDADIAVAHQSQQMALAVAEDLREDIKRVRGEMGEERAARQALGCEVQELRATVNAQHDTIQSLRRAVRAFKDAWADITANWHIVRLQDKPPKQPHTSEETL